MISREDHKPRPVVADADFWLAILLAIFALVAARLTLDLPEGGMSAELGAAFLPWLCIGGLGILAAMLLMRSVARSRHGEVFTVALSPRILAKLGVFALLMLVYGFAYLPLGYLASTSIFFVVAMLALGERRPLHVLVIPMVITLGVWAVFALGLKVVLP